MPKPRRSSTDRAAPVYAPAALDFEVMDGLGELLAVDWSVGEDDARFSKLRRLMTDPARVTAQLLKLPALGLLACEIVVEAGGLASWESVAAVLEERSGLDRATVARFLHGFQGGGVLTPAIALDRPEGEGVGPARARGRARRRARVAPERPRRRERTRPWPRARRRSRPPRCWPSRGSRSTSRSRTRPPVSLTAATSRSTRAGSPWTSARCTSWSIAPGWPARCARTRAASTSRCPRA
ncbi:MAG: hypothetical protein M5U28_55450 [Sandaracinaceae bacterium]|nr:hypothetical protein [Sandaracinaceae bacterium]